VGVVYYRFRQNSNVAPYWQQYVEVKAR
jgi:hypothetical protein